MAPHSDKMKLMRVVVREDFTKSRCDALINDFKLAIETLDQMDAKRIEDQRQAAIEFRMRRRSTLVSPQSPTFKLGKARKKHFEDDHSLQASHGKTHAVC
jgi:glutamate decarboxylase